MLFALANMLNEACLNQICTEHIAAHALYQEHLSELKGAWGDNSQSVTFHGWNFPAGQPTQVLFESSYVPGGHGLQGPPSAPRYPVLQVQLNRTVLPTGESACTGQLMHV